MLPITAAVFLLVIVLLAAESIAVDRNISLSCKGSSCTAVTSDRSSFLMLDTGMHRGAGVACGHGLTLQNKAVALSWMSFSPNWGNFLSPYWEGRGVAAVAGKQFRGPRMREYFFQFLPSEAPAYASLKDSSFLEHACSCGSEFSHKCSGAWTRIHCLIQDDTHAALEAFDKTPKGAMLVHTGTAKHNSDSLEVLVQLRLEFQHPQVGWPGKSFFQGRVPTNASKVIFVHQPYSTEQIKKGEESASHTHQTYDKHVQENITILLQGYKTLMKDICGDCLVQFQSGTQYSDYALIARHRGPVLCMGSSYCLWAALANRHGPVYMPSEFFGNGEKPPVTGGQGKGFFWNDAVLLGSPKIQMFELMRAQEILEWARSH